MKKSKLYHGADATNTSRCGRQNLPFIIVFRVLFSMRACNGELKISCNYLLLYQVLTHLLNHTLDFSWDDSNRVINRASLVRLTAELAKSYSIVATLIAESHDLNGQPFMVSLLSKCVVPNGSSSADGNICVALKTFVAAIASCSHSPKVCLSSRA